MKTKILADFQICISVPLSFFLTSVCLLSLVEGPNTLLYFVTFNDSRIKDIFTVVNEI